VGVVFLGLDGTFMGANPAALQFLGWPEEEIRGRRAFDIMHPDDRVMGVSTLAELGRGEIDHIRSELRFVRPDGHIVWGDASTELIRGPAGGPAYIQSVIVDVSERHRAQVAEAGFAGLLEACPDALINIDADSRIAFVTHEAERLFGYRRDELIAQPIALLFPDHVEAVRSGRRPWLTEGLLRGEVRAAVLVARRHDGSEFPAELSFSLSESAKGREIWAAFRDGAVRSQAAIVASSSDAIVGQNLDGVITSWNAAAERLYGYSADEVVGKQGSLLMPSDRSGDLAGVVGGLTSGEEIEPFEIQRAHRDGRVVEVSVTFSPIRDEAGNLVGASSVGRDITERKRVEEERRSLQERLHVSERLESLGRLAGGVAHDFNNLLAVIMNYAAFVAERTADDAAVHADVEQIQLAAERAARLTRQLLVFAHRETVEPELLDLNTMVDDMRQLLARSLGHDVRMRVRPAAGLPLIRADRGQIEQVLLNLAVNARDAMPDGGILTIETRAVVVDAHDVRLQPHGRPGPHVELSVADTGTGMTPEVVARAFEPFFSTKPAGEGTGLGLATVYGVVIEAGGGITVSSEPDRGTKFVVLLPAADSASP
jgi:PAS domain S-box-containing protein